MHGLRQKLSRTTNIAKLIADLIVYFLAFAELYDLLTKKGFQKYLLSIAGQYASYLYSLATILAIAAISIIPVLIYKLYVDWKEKNKPKIPFEKPMIAALPEGVEFYSNRSKLPPTESILEKATNYVGFLGIALSDLVTQKHEIILQTARRNVNITFLLLNPESELVAQVEKAWLASNLKERINASLKDLCRIKNGLPDFQQGYINIRTYDLLPIHTLIMVDNKFVRVDSYLYSNQPSSWTSIKYPDNAVELYRKYENSWNKALTESKEYKCNLIDQTTVTETVSVQRINLQ